MNKMHSLIIELLAAKDAVGVPSLEAADKVSEAKEEDMLEDFWHCSGWTVYLHCLAPNVMSFSRIF